MALGLPRTDSIHRQSYRAPAASTRSPLERSAGDQGRSRSRRTTPLPHAMKPSGLGVAAFSLAVAVLTGVPAHRPGHATAIGARERPAHSPLVALLSPPAGQEPDIRLVSRVVDRHFADRSRLCPGESATAAVPLPNDERRSVQEFLGPALLELQVHQMGDSFADFPAARDHLRALLRARPRAWTRFPNWAEGTPFRTWGLLGTVHHTGDRVGRLEAVGNHLCVADSTGVTWWARLEAVDLWPDAP